MKNSELIKAIIEEIKRQQNIVENSDSLTEVVIALQMVNSQTKTLLKFLKID